MGSIAVAMCSSEVNQSFQRVQLIALTVLFQEEQKLVAMLEREMVQQNPGVSWNDIAGLTTSKSLQHISSIADDWHRCNLELCVHL